MGQRSQKRRRRRETGRRRGRWIGGEEGRQEVGRRMGSGTSGVRYLRVRVRVGMVGGGTFINPKA